MRYMTYNKQLSLFIVAKSILGKVKLKAIAMILDLHSSAGRWLLTIKSRGACNDLSNENLQVGIEIKYCKSSDKPTPSLISLPPPPGPTQPLEIRVSKQNSKEGYKICTQFSVRPAIFSFISVSFYQKLVFISESNVKLGYK